MGPVWVLFESSAAVPSEDGGNCEPPKDAVEPRMLWSLPSHFHLTVVPKDFLLFCVSANRDNRPQ